MDFLAPSSRCCSVCGAGAPGTDYATFISAEHGWRLVRCRTDAVDLMNWFCPLCWQRHKQSIRVLSGGSLAPPSHRTAADGAHAVSGVHKLGPLPAATQATDTGVAARPSGVQAMG